MADEMEMNLKNATGKAMKVKSFFIEVFHLFKETAKNWNEHDPWRMSAIIAYYAIFSLPGLLIIIITVAGYFFSDQEVGNEIYQIINEQMGAQAAGQVQTIISQARSDDKSLLFTIIGIGSLVFGATGVFYHLKQSINTMWEVEAKPKKAWLKLIRDRIFSFGMVLVIGFLLLISLVASSLVTAFSGYLSDVSPNLSPVFFQLLNLFISLMLITVLFALMFVVLPDAKVRWRDVWVGAFVTALLFVIGKTLIGLYLGNSEPGSAYGAASSIVLMLLWVSYTSLILFYGAEFTQTYGRRHGVEIKPKEFAVRTKKMSLSRVQALEALEKAQEERDKALKEKDEAEEERDAEKAKH